MSNIHKNKEVFVITLTPDNQLDITEYYVSFLKNIVGQRKARDVQYTLFSNDLFNNKLILDSSNSIFLHNQYFITRDILDHPEIPYVILNYIIDKMKVDQNDDN